MKYINEEGLIVSDGQFRAMHPNSCFPIEIPEEDLLEFGFNIYEEPPYIPTEEELRQQLIQSITSSVQDLLDATARQKNYDGILSACSYVNSTNSIFKAEGEACCLWRDECWATCYQIMSDVENGLREIPTIEEVLQELPTAPW